MGNRGYSQRSRVGGSGTQSKADRHAVYRQERQLQRLQLMRAQAARRRRPTQTGRDHAEELRLLTEERFKNVHFPWAESDDETQPEPEEVLEGFPRAWQMWAEHGWDEMDQQDGYATTSPNSEPAAIGSDQPVQRQSQNDDSSSGDQKTLHAAADGLSGPSQTLPFSGKIQNSFGHHDVSDVAVHIGGPATQACAAMGAQAYATDGEVAFKEQPDLHTAAHEAAHVVQQRGGVSLSGGVGRAGDAYEKHADVVADLVERGQSAEAVLDQHGCGQETTGVQREGEDPTEWDNQWKATEATFGYFLTAFNNGVYGTFQAQAILEDQPSVGERILSVVAQAAIAGLLGGVCGYIAARVITQTMKPLIQGLWNAAIDAGRAAAEGGMAEAYDNATARDQELAALIAFCGQMSHAALRATQAVTEAFNDAAGNKDDQLMTIAEMLSLYDANNSAIDEAGTLAVQQCLTAWLNLLSGTGINWSTDVEDTSQRGVLGIVFNGAAGEPIQILEANVEGINSFLRAEMSGTRLSRWIHPEEEDDETYAHLPIQDLSLDLIVRTGDPTDFNDSFQVTTEIHDNMIDAGVTRGRGLLGNEASRNRAIYFAFGMNRDGWIYVDDDASWRQDYNYCADAGRWFLENVKTPEQVIQQLLNKTLPTVND